MKCIHEFLFRINPILHHAALLNSIVSSLCIFCHPFLSPKPFANLHKMFTSLILQISFFFFVMLSFIIFFFFTFLSLRLILSMVHHFSSSCHSVRQSITLFVSWSCSAHVMSRLFSILYPCFSIISRLLPNPATVSEPTQPPLSCDSCSCASDAGNTRNTLLRVARAS